MLTATFASYFQTEEKAVRHIYSTWEMSFLLLNLDNNNSILAKNS